MPIWLTNPTSWCVRCGDDNSSSPCPLLILATNRPPSQPKYIMNIQRREFLKSTGALAAKEKIPDAPGWGVKINPAWIENAAYQKSERLAKS